MIEINDNILNGNLSLEKTFNDSITSGKKVLNNTKTLLVYLIYFAMTLTAIHMIFIEFRLANKAYGVEAIKSYAWILKGALIYLAGHEFAASCFSKEEE